MDKVFIKKDNFCMAEQNLYVSFYHCVIKALRQILPDLSEDLIKRIELTPTRDVSHGDMATNAALITAKIAKRRPQEIAKELAERLQSVSGIEKAEPAGPGFVNLKLAPSVFQNLVSTILQIQEAYGNSQIGNNIKTNIEYVSANPTGPMHVGHCRGAVVGDVLAKDRKSVV